MTDAARIAELEIGKHAIRQALSLHPETSITEVVEAIQNLQAQLAAAVAAKWFMAPYESVNEGHIEGITWEQHAASLLADYKSMSDRLTRLESAVRATLLNVVAPEATDWDVVRRRLEHALGGERGRRP